MGYVSAAYQSQHGTVESSWQWQENEVLYTFVLPEGCKGKVPVKLTYDEQLKLRASADALKEVIKSLDI
jgi:hypothetical protein